MPRRWATQTREWAYRFLQLRDGDTCQDCHQPPPASQTLDIDHVDGVTTHNAPGNLQLLCRSCNVAKSNGARLHETPAARLHESDTNGHKAPSVPGVSERETADMNRAVGTFIAREAVDYQAGSQEMRANDLYEVPYRTWILGQLTKREFLTWDEAKNAGAEVVGCATVTASRYLDKLTSAAGPLQESRDMLRTRIITRKENRIAHFHQDHQEASPRSRQDSPPAVDKVPVDHVPVDTHPCTIPDCQAHADAWSGDTHLCYDHYKQADYERRKK